ncbi:GntR family transcriptional regulator [Pantoea sp. 18069]|uniref:GntR family transcriptional regulator n=1 Tax=Pantoea sp. 18069 TaxID=2681415 RepID=UPI00190FB552|nr:GntR family transcriptional regulator [Pantoea sp. 18069]
MRLQPRSLCMAIADKLRERILAHEWPPGAAVNDGDIASGYGVSRTPVREALKLLCHEGLLDAHARRGMTVAMPSPEQLREALALQQWLTRFVHEQAASLPADSMARDMLRMTDNRLQLQRRPAAAPSQAGAMEHGAPAMAKNAMSLVAQQLTHSPSRVA